MDGYCLGIQTQFKTITCFKCKFLFAVPSQVQNKWDQTGETFYCPSCRQSQHYTVSREQKLKDQLANMRQSRDRERSRADRNYDAWQNTEFQRRGHKAAHTRLKNQVSQGRCPLCKETFPELAAHLKEKHPDYIAEEELVDGTTDQE